MTTRARILALAAILAGASAAAAQLLLPGGLAGLFSTRSAPAELYGCPMAEDAEVRSEKPGRCPKCGMDLVPLSQTEHKGHAEPKPPAGGRSQALFTCPMHPSYVSDQPGDCPICNMSLVPLRDDMAAEASGIEGFATIRVRPEQKQLIGVRTGLVERKEVTRTIRAVGRVEYNEKTLSAVNLKFGGWIEELHLKATGDFVRKGDPLFAVYSPELYEAQKNYVLALEAVKARGGAATGAGPFLDQSLRSARERLLLWDIGEDQLQEVEAKGEPQKRLLVRSKVDGVVTERNVVLGAWIEPGKDLFKVADLTTVWINAEVYEYEVPQVKVGMEARVHLSSLPGDFLAGEVAFIYPYLDEQTRTVRVRLEFENAEGRLKPGMYASTSIQVPLGEQLTVDDGAILDSGARQVAFVEIEEGRFEPRQLNIGPRVDGQVVVLDGLKEGEKVVTSAAFLIDSESRLKAAFLRGTQGGGHQH